MDNSEATLDRIEAQRSTDVSHDQRSLIHTSFPSLNSSGISQSRGEGTTESVPDFLTNLRLSTLFDVLNEHLPIQKELFSALNDGNKKCIEKLKINGTPMACLKSNRGDSILHLAAVWGHLELVKSIISECPRLLLEPNIKLQLPLHVAASAGHLAIVEILIASVMYVSNRLNEEERERLNLYVVKDTNEDTPLHSALKRHNMKVALCLVNANGQASFLANKDGISPLYLAIKAGGVSLVKAMLGTDAPDGNTSSLDLQLQGRKYLAHAALELRSTDMLDAIINHYPSLINDRDEEGRTCLSFAASVGNYKGVCNLLDRSTSIVSECNDDRSFPIHVAVEKGHLKIVKKILQRCPYMKHMLNRQDQNILHIAAYSGKYEILHHLMTSAETYHLANEQDVDGNTPLHLATIKWRPKSILCLKGVKNVLIENNSGLTALDIAESKLQPHYIVRERLTLKILAYDCRYDRHVKPVKPPMYVGRDGNKDYINALLLVAALVATVTFAAGFTIPGGFKSSAPNLGMANLATDGRLILFLIFDMVAMQSSVVALIYLMFAHLGDPALRRRSLNVAIPALYVALSSMSCAFLFGIVIEAGKITWLIVVSSVIICFFFAVMMMTLFPQIFLHKAKHTSLRPGPLDSLTVYILLYIFLHIFLELFVDDGDESEQVYEESGPSCACKQ